MRINAARDVSARAWTHFDPNCVQVRIGVVSITASPEEAISFGRQLIAAGEKAAAHENV